VSVISADMESKQSTAFKLLMGQREQGKEPLLKHMEPLPEATHLGKTLTNGLRNYAVQLEGYRSPLALLGALADDPDVGERMQKLVPAEIRRAKDKQDPRVVMTVSAQAVIDVLHAVQSAVVTEIPERRRLWDSNTEETLLEPVCVKRISQRNFAVLDQKQGKILQSDWHSPCNVSVIASGLSSPTGLASHNSVIFVSDTGRNRLVYLDTGSVSRSLELRMCVCRRQRCCEPGQNGDC
jgi:hypothetical protein